MFAAMASERRRAKTAKKLQFPTNGFKPEQVELSLSDVTCTICMSIEIEPVTLPCGHDFCLPCFTDSIFIGNKQCPLCRLRIGAWARTATKQNSLINKTRWDRIRSTFPTEVNLRLSGDEGDIKNEFAPPLPKVALPGEIRREYEEQMRQLAKEIAEETRAGEELARKIAEEEQHAFKQQRRMEEADEALAWTVANAMDQEWSVDCPRSPPGDDATTATPQQPELFQEDESRDSISAELSYFLPICVAPQTPAMTAMLAPAARAPDCMQYQPNFTDTACSGESRQAIMSETNGLTSLQLENRPDSEELMDDTARQRQLEEDFRLAMRIQRRLQREQRRVDRDDYELRSKTLSHEVMVARKRRRCT